MLAEQVLLRKHICVRQRFLRLPVRPAVLISGDKCIVSAGGEQAAHGDVHEIDLLFLAKLARAATEFSHTDKKQERLHGHGFSKPLSQPGVQLPPFGGVVLVHCFWGIMVCDVAGGLVPPVL